MTDATTDQAPAAGSTAQASLAVRKISEVASWPDGAVIVLQVEAIQADHPLDHVGVVALHFERDPGPVDFVDQGIARLHLGTADFGVYWSILQSGMRCRVGLSGGTGAQISSWRLSGVA
jgi:hypothetical protein